MKKSNNKVKRKILRGRSYSEDDSKEDTPTKPPLAIKQVPFQVSSAKTRKELRKEQRKSKKAQKHQYLLAKVGREDIVRKAAEALVAGKKKKKKRKKKNKSKKNGVEGGGGEGEVEKGTSKKKEETAQVDDEDSEEEEDEDEKFVREAVRNKLEGKESIDLAEELKYDKEKMRKEMDEVRRKRMLEENEEEERTIKQLSKKLKLNKKAAIPASFRTDGLDFLLEVCENSSKKKKNTDESSDDEENEDGGDVDDVGEEESDLDSEMDTIMEDDEEEDTDNGEEEEDADSGEEDAEEGESDGGSDQEEDLEGDDADIKADNFSDDIVSDEDDDNVDSDDSEEKEEMQMKTKKNKNKVVKEKIKEKNDGVWEDIYGRLRSKDGSVLSNTTMENTKNSTEASDSGKYVPPALRGNQSKREKLAKQLKGLLNRLSESNMHSISTQIEELYMTNSRNEVNQTLLELLTAALVRRAVMPERVVLEHIMLIAVLHANVGTEVGAFFTQAFAQEFKSKYDNWDDSDDEEDKNLENLILIISFIYHFKIIDACLVYDILKFLSDSFKPKDIELILTVLKSIGFRLRKDDPAALKELILTLQQKAAKLQSGAAGSAKVKFMLEILMAIRNNNMNKIPNYDPSFGEHLLKILKGHLHPGNYVSELKIELQDLLNADKAGRWWIVGSAWAGKQAENQLNESGDKIPMTSEDAVKHAKLLKRARAQGMNTDTRRNIFCILMTAEDYMDAFEKLNHLGLRNNQDREIMHVSVYCCLQEKQFNPYYGLIASKFCAMDRKLMLALQFNLWDRLKDLDSLTSQQRTNLALLLVHFINDKSLPLSTLKVIEYAEMDKVKLKFLKRILSGILMQKEVDNLQEIFLKPAMSEKLSLFRESLRLFLSHFMLQASITTSDGSIVKSKLSPEEMKALKERVKIAEKCMSSGKGGLRAM